MTPEDRTHNPTSAESAAGAAESAAETLRRLEARLAQVSQAAEGLFERAADTAAAAGSAAKAGANAIPPAGWQLPRPHAEDRGLAGDLELVMRTLRELMPPELERRLAEALRELLLAVRALIDWYLERAELAPAARSEVQDIPIL